MRPPKWSANALSGQCRRCCCMPPHPSRIALAWTPAASGKLEMAAAVLTAACKIPQRRTPPIALAISFPLPQSGSLIVDAPGSRRCGRIIAALRNRNDWDGRAGPSSDAEAAWQNAISSLRSPSESCRNFGSGRSNNHSTEHDHVPGKGQYCPFQHRTRCTL